MTPAEIAARAAAVAAEWTPERIAKLDDDGVLDVRLRLDGLVAIQNLLADRERLQGLVAALHEARPTWLGNEIGVRVIGLRCACGWERGDSIGSSSIDKHAAHVAAILDGGGACRP